MNSDQATAVGGAQQGCLAAGSSVAHFSGGPLPPPAGLALDLIVRVGDQDEPPLQEFLDSLQRQTIGLERFRPLFWCSSGTSTQTRWRIESWLQQHRRTAGAIFDDAETITLASLIEQSQAPWLAFRVSSHPLQRDDLAALIQALASATEPMSAHAVLGVPSRLTAANAVRAGSPPAIADLDGAPFAFSSLLARQALVALSHVADPLLPADLAPEVWLWYLLLAPGARIAVAPAVSVAPPAEPATSVWSDVRRYDAFLRDGLLAPLNLAKRQGRVPSWLQQVVLGQLHWYFTVDGRARAPTVVVGEALAERFHASVAEIMALISPDALQRLGLSEASAEVRHVLWSYRNPRPRFSAALDAWDHEQKLARLTYWIHGVSPKEQFVVDGRAVKPSFQKYRACCYFRRQRLRQRIVWLPVSEGERLSLELDGRPVKLDIGPESFDPDPLLIGDAAISLPEARSRFAPGKGGQLPLPAGWRGWRVLLVKALARIPWVREAYRQAWVLIDREEDADDSAEHLYRWLRVHHPELNIWFLLTRDSPDWPRLASEGFRLVAPGLRRKLLLLNSAHIISTHTDYVFGGFDRRLYGDAMHWRYTFLQHGVIKDDLSHWLGPREFDAFITSSPAEHASIVGDDTPYPYTDREVRRTGLARHDRLLRYAAETPAAEINLLLVMPTWRGSLIDERAEGTEEQRQALFAQSEYATQWRDLMANPRLHEFAQRAGLRLAFMPHPNALPYVSAFKLPESVMLVTAATMQVQRVFVRTKVFITDYTSVAFTMALLRRAVLYFQFDQDRFYGGSHNWREGYFDYARDGFGPVALDAAQLLSSLDHLVSQDLAPEPTYLARMIKAMPDTDQNACQQTYEAITSLGQPGAAPRPDAGSAVRPSQPGLGQRRVAMPGRLP